LLYRAYWVNSTPPRSSCFQVTLAVFQTTPAPAHLRSRVHPLRYLAPSSEFTSASNLPSDRSQKTPFMRSSLPFATLAPRVHSRRVSQSPPMFRPQCFSHSRRLAPLETLQACFILQPRLGFALQGLSPMLSPNGSSPFRSLLTFCDSLLCSRVTPTTPDPEAWPPEL